MADRFGRRRVRTPRHDLDDRWEPRRLAFRDRDSDSPADPAHVKSLTVTPGGNAIDLRTIPADLEHVGRGHARTRGRPSVSARSGSRRPHPPASPSIRTGSSAGRGPHRTTDELGVWKERQPQLLLGGRLFADDGRGGLRRSRRRGRRSAGGGVACAFAVETVTADAISHRTPSCWNVGRMVRL